jgi:hypothetical protein
MCILDFEALEHIRLTFDGVEVLDVDADEFAILENVGK